MRKRQREVETRDPKKTERNTEKVSFTPISSKIIGLWLTDFALSSRGSHQRLFPLVS